MRRWKPITTFSIAAYDPAEQSWGVATASKFMAVGAVVPWARAGAGAVATQSLANMGYGPQGLDLMESGLDPKEVLKRLTGDDDQRELRQVGLVGPDGRTAMHTGNECIPWAGGIEGDRFVVVGNLLVGEQVVQAVASTFESAQGELGDRLHAALLAGDRAGGDRRGRQGAALLVVKPNGSYGGTTDRYIDLRVDDHAEPVVELGRLLRMHHLFLGAKEPEAMVALDQALLQELQAVLRRRSQYAGEIDGAWGDVFRKAFQTFVDTENLEERVDLEQRTIHPLALAYIRENFG